MTIKEAQADVERIMNEDVIPPLAAKLAPGLPPPVFSYVEPQTMSECDRVGHDWVLGDYTAQCSRCHRYGGTGGGLCKGSPFTANATVVPVSPRPR